MLQRRRALACRPHRVIYGRSYLYLRQFIMRYQFAAAALHTAGSTNILLYGGGRSLHAVAQYRRQRASYIIALLIAERRANTVWDHHQCTRTNTAIS